MTTPRCDLVGAACAVAQPSDGETLTASIWKGLPLTDSGFLTVAAEYKDQEHTERGGWDHAPAVSDRERRRSTRARRRSTASTAWYGEPELSRRRCSRMRATTSPIASRSTAGRAGRTGTRSAPASIVRAGDARNIPSIYPDGFLPLIAADVTDYSAAFGTRWELGAWHMDRSLVYGLNKMEFTIEHTLNRSIGPTSKTKFDAGGFDYDQLVLNVSGVRAVEIGAFASPLNVAVGLEARRETYSIFAGEPDSYRNGGVLLANGDARGAGRAGVPGLPAGERRSTRTGPRSAPTSISRRT